MNPSATLDSRRSELQPLGRLLLQRLYTALKMVRFYEETNTKVTEAARHLKDFVQMVHSADGEARIIHHADCFFLNGVRLRVDLSGREVARTLRGVFGIWSIGVMDISAAVSVAEISTACRLLGGRPGRRETAYEEISAAFTEAGITGIRLGDIGVAPPAGDEDDEETVHDRSVRTFFDAISFTRETFLSPTPAADTLCRARRMVHRVVDLLAEDDSVLLSLTQIKNYDDATFNHSVNVAIYSAAVGLKLGLPRADLADLGLAGLLHDIGKTRIPRNLLYKANPLTPEEARLLEEHPVFGCEALLGSEVPNPSLVRCLLVAFEHHLGMNLQGYPDLIDHREIGLFTRIVAIVDAYDCIASPTREGAERVSPQDAIGQLMADRESVHDSILVKVFVNTIGVLPVGTLVELSNGESAIVTRANALPGDFVRPVVRVFADASGNRIAPRMEDLSKRDDAGHALLRVVRSMDPVECFDTIDEYIEVL